MVKRSGFTLVELLITLVVMGVQTEMSFLLFTNTALQGRDAEREADVAALSRLLESYYLKRGAYPLLSAVSSTTLPGLNADFLVAPGAAGGNSLVSTTTPSKIQYGYVTYTADMTPCTSGTNCGKKYLLTWYSEATQSIQKKASLN